MNQAILTVPHQVLRRKSAPIEQITPEIRAHIHNLMDTIQYAHDPEGVGLSFPQILSSFPARLFLHEYDHLEGVLFTDYTLKNNLPLYFLDRDQDKFVPIQDPSSVIKW